MFPMDLASDYLTVTTIDKCYNNNKGGTSFILRSLPELKSVNIGDDCFGKFRTFELDSLVKLESVVIGQKSFTYAKTDDEIWNNGKDNQRGGSYRIVNCPKLRSIRVGNYTFGDYHSFEISDLPSLQSIVFGVRNFYWTSSFSLTGLTD